MLKIVTVFLNLVNLTLNKEEEPGKILLFKEKKAKKLPFVSRYLEGKRYEVLSETNFTLVISIHLTVTMLETLVTLSQRDYRKFKEI